MSVQDLGCSTIEPEAFDLVTVKGDKPVRLCRREVELAEELNERNVADEDDRKETEKGCGLPTANTCTELVDGFLWVGNIAAADAAYDEYLETDSTGVNASCFDFGRVKFSHVVSILDDLPAALSRKVTSCSNVKHLHVRLRDARSSNLLEHVSAVCAFLQTARASAGAKVLLHCLWGQSRSCALAAAFMMQEMGFTLAKALGRCRSRRPACFPNQGFLAQLVQLEVMLLGCASDLRLAEGMEMSGIPSAWHFITWKSSATQFQVACHGLVLLVRKVREDPKIAYITGLVSKHEARHILEKAQSALKPSRVVSHTSDEATKQGVESKGRISFSCRIGWGGDPVVKDVVRRAAFLCNLTPAHAEPVQVVKYEAGGEYRPHYDWFDPEGPHFATKTANGGQRLISIFCYLQECAEGGETCFPELGLTFPTRFTDAVLWWNIDRKGQTDTRTLHAGCPVFSGEKYGMNIWLRQQPRALR